MKTRLILILGAIVLMANAVYAQDKIDLAKTWRFSTDPMNIGQKNGWQKPGLDTSKWRDINATNTWEDQGVTQSNPNYKPMGTPTPYDGYAWYRQSVIIPNEWKGKNFFLNLGKIDDQDWTYFNGNLIGQTTTFEDPYLVFRSYRIPQELIKFGQPNLIAVRVLDFGVSGGMTSAFQSITSSRYEATSDNTKVNQQNDEDKVQVQGNVVVEKGETVKDAVAITGSVTVRGHVTGDATAVMGNVIVEDGGVVDGSAVTVGGRIIQRDGGVIRGSTTSVGGWSGFTAIPWGLSCFGLLFGIWGRIAYALIMAALAALIVALFPARMEQISAVVIEQPGRSALYGIIGGLLIVPIGMVLLFTIVGIPLVPLEILLVIIAFLVAQVCAGLAVGERVISAMNKPALPPVLAAAIGVLLLGIVKLVPFAGGLLAFVLYLLAFGAVIMTGFGTKREWFADRFQRRAPAQPQPPSQPSAPGSSIEPADRQ
ncbi:MAG: sugar-binding domain-containing protein [Armatimonadota bacterium]